MKAVVLFSGGLDSTVLVQQLIHDQASVRLLSINYGQRHKKELSHSSRIATSMNLPHRILDLPDLAELLSGSSLTDSSVELPEGHYAEESMKSTVVPNRNMNTSLPWLLAMPCRLTLIPSHILLMPGTTRSIRTVDLFLLMRCKMLFN